MFEIVKPSIVNQTLLESDGFFTFLYPRAKITTRIRNLIPTFTWLNSSSGFTLLCSPTITNPATSAVSPACSTPGFNLRGDLFH